MGDDTDLELNAGFYRSGLTQQEIIATEALHHRTFENPSWNQEEPFNWPTCTKCGKAIFTHGDEESGIGWACSDPECEMR